MTNSGLTTMKSIAVAVARPPNSRCTLPMEHAKKQFYHRIHGTGIFKQNLALIYGKWEHMGKYSNPMDPMVYQEHTNKNS